MMEALVTILFWLLFLPALFGTGALAGFRLREQNPLFAGFLSIGLGLAVYAHVLIFAGSLNQLKPAVPIFFIFLSFVILWKKWGNFFSWIKSVFSFFLEQKGGLTVFYRLSLIGMLLLTLVLCFFPEISNDALAIQLYLAKLFSNNSSILPSYFDIASFRPLLMSVLYSTGVLFKSVAIAKLFHWFCGFLLIIVLMIKINDSTQNKKQALFFGLMLWLTPTLLNQITTTYIDAGVSLFVLLGYFITVGSIKETKPIDYFYGGLFIGMAVAARYLAMAAFFSIMIMLAFRFVFRAEKKQTFIMAIFLSLGMLLTSGFWFLRALIFTGNPVYPYLGSLFGTEDFSLFSSIYFHGMGLPRSLWTFLAIPFDITLKPRYFDYHHWVGPFYLLLLPFAAYAAIKVKSVRPHLIFTLLFTTFWYFTGQNVRYLLPTLPIYLLAGAVGLSDAENLLRGKIPLLKFVNIAAVFLTVAMLCLSFYHFRYQFQPILRVWSMETYLEKMERTVPIARWVNANLPLSSKILVLDEPRLFYFDRLTVLDFDFDVRTKYKSAQRPEEIVQILKSNGITHLLVMTPRGELVSERHDRLMDSLLSNNILAKKETTIESKNIQNLQYIYTLYALN